MSSFNITLTMGTFYYGLQDTSATYAINFLNLVPVSTFIFCIIARMEKLRLATKEGKFKALGTILCLGGALITSLYKGKNLIQFGHPKIHKSINLSKHHWTRGTFLLVGHVLCSTTWFMMQVKLLNIFPFKFTSTMFACIISSLQSTVIGLCIDKSKTSWQLEWNLQLITIVYSGALNTAVTYCLTTWVIEERGPAYPPMFNPIALILTAFFECLIFGEPITLGSLMGSLVLIVGLCTFIWAKSKEYKKLQGQAKTNVRDIIVQAND